MTKEKIFAAIKKNSVKIDGSSKNGKRANGNIAFEATGLPSMMDISGNILSKNMGVEEVVLTSIYEFKSKQDYLDFSDIG